MSEPQELKIVGDGPKAFDVDVERVVSERQTVRVRSASIDQALRYLSDHPEEIEGGWETFDKAEHEVLAWRKVKSEIVRHVAYEDPTSDETT
ncbi:MAG: hypothetical protein L0312_20075 [Acidobacteria bacterium]|nr:hypothetical protein [Acidobacteriota bacterium]